MSREENLSQKSHTLMQLEEVNRATSPAEYDRKMRRWAADRGLTTADQWNFQIMMQYCERLEQEKAVISENYWRLSESMLQLEGVVIQHLGRLQHEIRKSVSPGRPSGQPGEED